MDDTEVKSLCELTGYSERIIAGALPGMVKQELIKGVGRPIKGRFAGANQELYMLGKTPPVDGPYVFRPRLRCKIWNPKSLHNPSGLITSDKLIVPLHAYYVSEVASWIVQIMTKDGIACLAVPEQVLRQEYGWYWEKKTRRDRFSRRRSRMPG